MSTPVQAVSLNISRGLQGMARQICARLVAPHLGQQVASGLGEIVAAVIQEHPSIPQRDIPAAELLRALGVIPGRHRAGS